MRMRNIVNNKVVIFGSLGKNPDGTAIKANNYVDDLEAVVASLRQKLQVLRGELWYSSSFGLPLFDKNKSKISLDLAISNMVLATKNVITILHFESEIVDRNYHAKIEIKTTFGEAVVSI